MSKLESALRHYRAAITCPECNGCGRMYSNQLRRDPQGEYTERWFVDCEPCSGTGIRQDVHNRVTTQPQET